MFKDERVWRVLSALWTFVFMIFVTVDFFSLHRYEHLTTPLAALYAGILTLYAGTKEFDRWYDLHDQRHPGEFFVAGWTILMVVLFCFTAFGGEKFFLSPDVIATYIMVLSIFALTQKSKQLHRQHLDRKIIKRKKK